MADEQKAKLMQELKKVEDKANALQEQAMDAKKQAMKKLEEKKDQLNAEMLAGGLGLEKELAKIEGQIDEGAKQIAKLEKQAVGALDTLKTGLDVAQETAAQTRDQLIQQAQAKKDKLEEELDSLTRQILESTVNYSVTQ